MYDNQKGNSQYQSIQNESFAETPQSASPGKLLMVVAKRWKMVLILSLIISLVIIPFIWLLGKNFYETEGAIRVTPVVSPILFRDVESQIPMPNYENFVNTQASLMTSNNVLNRVADELYGKDIEFFEGVKDYAVALKIAVKNEAIIVEPVEETELVRLVMNSPNPKQAEQILNAFIRSYMAVIASDEVRGGDKKLAILEEKKRRMQEQIAIQQQQIRDLAEEYGSATLEERYEMLLHQVTSIQAEITALEIQQMSLEANIKMNEGRTNQRIQPSELMALRNDFVYSDLTMQTLLSDLATQESAVLELKEVMAPDSDRLMQQKEVLNSLQESIEKREKELVKKFDEEFKSTMIMNQEYNVSDLKSQLETSKEYAKKLRERFYKANNEAIKMGRKQLAIDNLQEKVVRMEELVNAVNRRIDELQMERKRPARVSVAYMASSVPAQSRKMQFTAMVFFGSIGLSSLLMILLEKMDTSLRGPQDIVTSAGVNIIGTTTNPDNLDNATHARLLAEDYQTIRANIGLINPESDKKILVVTSPGVGDGKTTFAINLATSYARSGKKTLLIDGDFRKSDIASKLKLPENARKLQDIFNGTDPKKAVFHVSSTGMDVLASDKNNDLDIVDLLARPDTTRTIKVLCAEYDHVIIDTPPVMAFADAMLWAQIADGVILTTFVDRTCSVAFKEAVERMKKLDVLLIGAVVNNIRLTDSYRYNGFVNDYDGDFGINWPFDEDRDSALLISSESKQNKSQES